MKNKRSMIRAAKSLTLNRETLRQLSASELGRAAGGFTDGSDCIATAYCNSVRPFCPAPGSRAACPQ